MPVERVIYRVKRPGNDECNESDTNAVRPHQRDQEADADADWKAPRSWSRCSLYGGKSMNAPKERGNGNDHNPKISMKPPTTVVAIVTNILCQGFEE